MSNISTISVARRERVAPSAWDGIALCLVAGTLALIIYGAQQMNAPLASVSKAQISLSPAALPEYALRTTLRMFAALAASLLFTFTYATAAAKSRRAGAVLIPILDVLQSVPVLGFLSFTVTGFMAIFPGSVAGAECAAIFAIFTAQAWNMAFSFYQSLRTIPADLDEASRAFRLSAWQRFWRLEVPFALPALIWNMMMSMSGSWFFIVASEAISVGNTTITLPGIGSYVALAIERRDLTAVFFALGAMLVVILAYDQLLFRPLVAWAQKFRFEQTMGQPTPGVWLLRVLNRARLVQIALVPVHKSFVAVAHAPLSFGRWGWRRSPLQRRWLNIGWGVIWWGLWALVGAYGLRALYVEMAGQIGWAEVFSAFKLGLMTLTRVIVLVGLASLVWVPVGVWIGLRPGLAMRLQLVAQILAAFPANLLFPVAVVGILHFGLNPNIWLSPLMILGTQWYILFNVIAGASAFPIDLQDAAANFRVRGRNWWFKVMLPGVFPYFITGGLTASGGSWNASIVAELVTWGNTRLEANGLGSYIAKATAAGDYPRIILGVMVMAVFVTLFNRLFWRPLHAYAERRLRMI
ncbi:ABC transporter permease subunit [Parvibaculum sedimenti]|uniref:ABC transporter permease subunit n=1 Tax=Parvibaculum sedimenti TaxID=2608632 RepID=A0A6N6VFV1_9HYPH|nr:ABC transporter permease subunit [Parvibaculum sedimenti]KAB7739586.1 ABC transporter permease subunit [Parvibaculum sedimenti]